MKPELLAILRCPDSMQKLELASPEMIQQVNQRIRSRSIKNKNGSTVEQEIEGGLIREDRSVLYPIRENIPTLLIGEGILL
ncbi:MAG: Trm112 family protein [Verrucomicrobiota bacterium]|nr:Trm112 family protein [Verrucomicrobiota bacterium]